MLKNPFTPVFGGKPTVFFGRTLILSRFDQAFVDQGSEYRALFVTGTRGSGKTALLEQLSNRAQRKGWRVIDLGPENTVSALVRRIAGHDEITKTVDPQVSINVFGTVGSVGGVSTSRTTHADRSDLDLLLIDACAHEAKGIMVTIDEIQKVSEEDVSAISNAFQMASRKGCEAILVVAGLPYSREAVIAYRGCTFMRRCVHQRLGLLDRLEVSQALSDVPRSMGVVLQDSLLHALIDASYGHPYMVQLLGYHLINRVNEAGGANPYHATQKDVNTAIERAVEAYKRRAIDPMVAELAPAERAYLTAAAKVLNNERTASVSDICRLMGKDSKQTSPSRDRLLKTGLMLAPARGKLMFTVPYLADFLLTPSDEQCEVERLRMWGV